MEVTKQELESLLVRRPEIGSDMWGSLTVINDYKHLPIEGKTVMDIGGNIGAFAVYAYLAGAKKIITYEPEASNFRVLKKNCEVSSKILVWNRALTNDPSRTSIQLWITPSGQTMGSCSTTKFRGRIPQQVLTANFALQVEYYQPESIKMDCEGEEWDLLLNNDLPDCVQDVAMEIHYTKKHWREEFLLLLLRKYREETGWQWIKEPKNTGQNFHCLAHLRRL